MTVNTLNITSGPYVGNNLNDTYSYGFTVADKNQLNVYETTDLGVQTLLVVDTDYTVNNIGVDGGGTVVRLAGNLPTNYQWYIRSNRAENQLTSFASQGAFFPDIHEAQMDHLTFLIQQLSDKSNRTVRISDSDPDRSLNLELPFASNRASKIIGFDSVGNVEVTTFSISSLPDAVIFNSKSAAIAYINSNGVIADQLYFVTSNDGGTFVGVTSASLGTYSDNGGAYCGTVFIPTGGDGSTALVRDGYEFIDPIFFGAVGDGVTDDSSAINNAHLAAVAQFKAIIYPIDNATYVCGNFPRPSSLKIIANGAKWLISSTTIPINSSLETNGEVTQYISPTGDDANNNGLTSSTAFKSIQHGVDCVPINVKHRQVIQLTDGTHSSGSRNTNPIPGASTVRTVRVLIDGKNINGRDMLVIQGNTTNKSLTVINHDDVYSAIYIEEVNGVVVKDVTIDFSSNTGAVISIFQHRRGDTRLSDLEFIGNDFDGSHAIIVETGAFIEIAGDISITNVERAIVSLEGVISFIGTSITHDGGTATSPRTFEIGSEGQLYIFTGVLTVSNVLRLCWNKGGYALISPSSSSVAFSGFALDCTEGATIKASKISSTGGALAVNNDGGLVKISICTFIDQTTSAVKAFNGATTVIDDCTLRDTTNLLSIVDVESGNLIISGDGDIDGGYRGVYANNCIVHVGERMNFLNSDISINANNCLLSLKGTTTYPITFSAYRLNALSLIGGSCKLNYVTITNPTGLTAIDSTGCSIENVGAMDIDGGNIGLDLKGNSSFLAESTVGSSLTNLSNGIIARRGAQAYYRSASMSFTGTTTNTTDIAAEFSLVTSF